MESSYFFLPRRISQDLVGNAFSRIRVAIGHARLDHSITFNACTEVNMMKEVRASVRSLNKRNAAGAITEIKENLDINASHDKCLEYASKWKIKSLDSKNIIDNTLNKFNWSLVNGIKKTRLTN